MTGQTGTDRAGIARLVALSVALAIGATATGCTDGDDYQGGVLIDTADVVADVRVQLLPPDEAADMVPAAAPIPNDAPDDERAEDRREATAVAVDGRVVTVSRPATVCALRPDVVVEVDGDRVQVRLIVPTRGVPCPDEGWHYLATIELRRQFDRYSVG
ncbi:MAG: hypothetical protein AAGD35_08415 [Actinomycetota bacterium]